MQIKKILFPTDFSANATNCLPFLRAVADLTGAEIYLFHAFHHRMLDPNIPPSKFEEKAEEEQKLAKSRLTSMCHQFAGDDQKLYDRCNTEVRIGFADDEIVEIVNEKGVDLVIMGTKGATGVGKVMLGSVAAEVIDEVKCPVLAVPENASYDEINHIVFATDLDHKDIPLINEVANFAKHFNAELTVLHIKQEEYELVKDLLDAFSSRMSNAIKYEHVKFRYLRHKKKIEGIDRFLEDNEAQILAMVTHKRPLFAGLFKRSLTRQIAHQARMPLLAFHETA